MYGALYVVAHDPPPLGMTHAPATGDAGGVFSSCKICNLENCYGRSFDNSLHGPQTCTIFYPQDPRQTTPHQGRERACQHATMHIYLSIFLSSYLSIHLSLALSLLRSGEADEALRSSDPWRFSGWWNAKASSLWRCKSLDIYPAPVHAENYVWVVMLAYVRSKTFHVARADVYRS